MKNLLITLSFILISISLYAQDHCGYKVSKERYEALKKWHLENSKEKKKVSERSDVSVPVTLWVLNNTPYLHLINTQDFISEMNGVKAVFSEFGIDLDLWENDVRQIYLPSATNYDYSDDYQNISNNYFKDNTLNIYVANTISGGGKTYDGILATPNIDPQNPTSKDFLVIARNHVNNYTLTHEIGHYFGLLHTWGVGSYDYGQVSVTDEKVNGTNCLTTGDLICDTPADPGNGHNSYICGTYVCSGNPINACYFEPSSYYTKRYNPLPDNYMTYNNKYKNCSRSFTAGQKNAMKLFAAQFRDYGSPSLDCDPDYYEPNSVSLSNSSAFSYTIGQNENYSILANTNDSSDADRYRFKVSNSGKITIKLSGLGYPCELFLYDNYGLVGSSEQLGVSPEEINYDKTSTSLRTFYVLVLPTGTSDVDCSNNTYTLEVGLSNDSGCNDSYEPNDIKAQGEPLTVNYLGLTSAKSSYISSPADVDYFKTVIGDKGTYRFSLSNLSGDYDMYITKNSNNQGWQNIRFGSQSEIVEIEHQFNSNDTYYIKVVGKGGYYSCDDTYTVGVLALSSDQDNCNDTEYEPNNTFATAKTPFNPVFTAPSTQSIEALISSSGDTDWYKVGVNGQGDLHIKLDNLPTDYDIKIYQNNSSSLVGQGQKSGQTNENVFISKTWANSDVYYIKVEGYNAAFACQDKYRLIVNWSPDVNDCQGDQYEGVQNTYSLTMDNIGSGHKQKTLYSTIHNSNDYDYFQVQLDGPGRLEANLSSLPQNYDLDIGHFYNGNYTYIDYSTRLGTSNESVEHVKTSSYTESVYVGVKSPLGVYDCDDTYKLYVRWIPDNSGGGGNNCSDNDNTLQTANNLFSTFSTNRSETHYAYLGSSTDVDYYEINSNGAGELNINLSSLPSNYDFDFVLQNGTVLLSSKNYGTADENRYVVYNSAGAGRVYVKVYAPFGKYSCTDSYKITATWTSTAQSACTNVGSYESNETISTAKNLWGSFSTSYMYEDISSIINSPSDIDYYRINLSQSGRIELSLYDLPYNNNNPKNYDLYLYNAQGVELKRGTKSGNSGEWFTYTSAGSETLYAKVVGVNGQYDCDDDYNLQLIWYPINNGTTGGGGSIDPCDYVIDLNFGSNINNIVYGTDFITNYDCVQGLNGKEMIFSFSVLDGYGADNIYHTFNLTGLNDPNVKMMLLDDCTPNSYCYATAEENFGSISLQMNNLSEGRTYYIFIDGYSDFNPFDLHYTIIYTTLSAGISNIQYQCIGSNYNVIIEFKESITDFNAGTFNWNYLGNDKYIIQSVFNQEVELSFTTINGLNNYTIPAYDCNVFVENCFGLDPPAVPALAVSCPDENVPTAEIYNPSGYDILWYENEDDQNPIDYGNVFTPKEYGVYYVQFSNAFLGCESSKIAVEFSQEEELQATPILLHNHCFADNSGQIDLIIDRDLTNYQFNWSTGDNDVTSINSLSAGEYTVSITTAYGCESEHTFKVSEPQAIQSNGLSDNHLCKEESILLEPEIVGGSPPYRFIWSTGDTTASVSVDEEGYYEVEVFDASYCSTVFDYYITKSQVLELSFVHEFYGDQNYLTVLQSNVQDGKWNTGQVESEIEIDDSGWYWYEIEDAEGCITRDSVNISLYEPLEVEAIVENSYCQNNNGKITINATNGVPPLLYSFNDEPYTSEHEFLDLSQGEYNIKIRDSHGNIDTFDVEVKDELDAIEGSLTFSNNLITIDLIDKFPPYTVFWNGVQTDSLVFNPTIDGTYFVDLIDNNGCSFTDSIEVQLTTSISNLSKEIDVKVFPNPFHDIIYIEFSKSDHYKISLMNTLGQELLTKNFNAGSVNLEVESVQNKMYFVVIKNRLDQIIHIEKVIKL